MTNNFLKAVKHNLIVSCQALENEPLHSSFIMARMARAARIAGASAIRANSVVDVQAIQDETHLPIIGIIKKNYGNTPTYITPTMKEMRAIAATGCEVVACQVTGETRPNGELISEIIEQFKQEFPDTLLMADTDSLENVRIADKLGFDIIGTTMHGYTSLTRNLNIADNDFNYLKAVLKTTSRPVLAEGKIDTPDKLKRCLELGSWAVVVGGAITRPLEITKKFVDATIDY